MLPKGTKREVCVKGLHEMTEDNIWTRPNDGARYCQACRKETNRLRRAVNRLKLDDERRSMIPDHQSLSDKIRLNKEKEERVKEQDYHNGFDARIDGAKIGDFVSDFTPYSSLWYRQRSRWEAGYKDAAAKRPYNNPNMSVSIPQAEDDDSEGPTPSREELRRLFEQQYPGVKIDDGTED